MSQVLLTLIARPDVEDVVVDWLLDRDDLSGFTSVAARGHSRAHGRFSLAEQVTGHQRSVVFHVQIESTLADPLLAAMRSELCGLGLRYWLVPLLESGAIE
ncbi:MAG: DUF3240 family protein [Halothiobacillaceae bacterium]